jgi:FkbM family methyltransferase
MNALEKSARWLKYKAGLEDSSALTNAIRPYYDRFLSKIYERQGLPRRMFEGEEIRIRPAHRYYHNGYEPEAFRYLRTVIRPGDTVLEVGTNIGIFTVLLARWVAPRGRVYGFEPAPASREALRDHLALNGVAEHVTIVPAALGSEQRLADFYADGVSGQNTLSPRHTRIPGAARISVAVDTLDSFCQSNHLSPRVIKIDVEGFEHQVLAGGMGTLRAARPLVVAEFHPMLWGETGSTAADIKQTLNASAYDWKALSGQRDVFSEYGQVALEPCEMKGSTAQRSSLLL